MQSESDAPRPDFDSEERTVLRRRLYDSEDRLYTKIDAVRKLALVLPAMGIAFTVIFTVASWLNTSKRLEDEHLRLSYELGEARAQIQAVTEKVNVLESNIYVLQHQASTDAPQKTWKKSGLAE